MQTESIATLGQLKEAGYISRSIKEELRDNLIKKLQSGTEVFTGIKGFEDSVIPDLERAILSRHSILLLGLRGQAKTRIARLMVGLLDEFMPIVEGSEINDDPLNPISKYGRDKVKQLGDQTPISWIHRSERYIEKLATPDVSVADLIGDIDPIKAANQKLNYSDENAIHFGLIPRANRSIFVINELPDLQARIQVSLFNILQEGDLQIRGFKLRLPLDVEFVFTANPEDYTNRGSIITPLKDRIQSQILTHYPKTLEIAREITRSEARLHPVQQNKVEVSELHRDLLESLVIEARQSEYTDEKSGVSARMSISALENLVSSAERRLIKNKEVSTQTRLGDFWGVIPAIIGKLELVYEGEQEGVYNVAIKLLDLAIKKTFDAYFPNPDRKNKQGDPYGALRLWFQDGNEVSIMLNSSDDVHHEQLLAVPGLQRLVVKQVPDEKLLFPMMELVLHGLAQYNVIGRNHINQNLSFSDPISDIFDMDDDEDEDL